MGEMLYNSLSQYFATLQKTGYYKFSDMQKLLIFAFYKDFVYSDFRGILSRDDYRLIERALDCLYGSTCLIPYPDYLKMGNLHLGEITEMAQRMKNLENTNVLKLIHNLDEAEGEETSDVIVIAEE